MTSNITLNDSQTKAYVNLKKFLVSKNNYNFLLLGPAGSGKTTVIVNTFNGYKKRIAFCAFTNKATQVLRNIADKFAIDFTADFFTIHKLLMLEPKYLDKETEVAFTFDKTKVEHLKMYDIVIFDECSTISQELFKYIREAWEYMNFSHGLKLKCIFLGDIWQLNPVGEDKSIVFPTATREKWPVSRLDKVMRSANDDMLILNNNLLSFIPKFKDKDVDDFVKKYPYNLIPKGNKTNNKYLTLDDFLDKYLETWQSGTPDTVIITYSRANCEKNNFAIQDRLDEKNGREIPERREEIKFYAGDRCCLDRPIEVYTVKDRKVNITNQTNVLTEEALEQHTAAMELIDINENVDLVDLPELEQINISKLTPGKKRLVTLNESTGEMLYNGEIFDILHVEDVSVITPLNRFSYMPKSFEAQLLTIHKISDASVFYEIIHIDKKHIDKARVLIKSHERRMFYLNIMTDFIKKYPKLDYGYCITAYKSQGSEYHTVFAHLNSVKWSIVGQGTAGDLKKKLALFRTTYTVASRASNKLWCYWSV